MVRIFVVVSGEGNLVSGAYTLDLSLAQNVNPLLVIQNYKAQSQI